MVSLGLEVALEGDAVSGDEGGGEEGDGGDLEEVGG